MLIFVSAEIAGKPKAEVECIKKIIIKIQTYLFSNLNSLIQELISTVPELGKYKEDPNINEKILETSSFFLDFVMAENEVIIDSQTSLSSEREIVYFSTNQFEILNKFFSPFGYIKRAITTEKIIGYFFWTTDGKTFFVVIGVSHDNTGISVILVYEYIYTIQTIQFQRIFPDVNVNHLREQLNDLKKSAPSSVIPKPIDFESLSAIHESLSEELKSLIAKREGLNQAIQNAQFQDEEPQRTQPLSENPKPSNTAAQSIDENTQPQDKDPQTLNEDTLQGLASLFKDTETINHDSQSIPQATAIQPPSENPKPSNTNSQSIPQVTVIQPLSENPKSSNSQGEDAQSQDEEASQGLVLLKDTETINHDSQSIPKVTAIQPLSENPKSSNTNSQGEDAQSQDEDPQGPQTSNEISQSPSEDPQTLSEDAFQGLASLFKDTETINHDPQSIPQATAIQPPRKDVLQELVLQVTNTNNLEPKTQELTPQATSFKITESSTKGAETQVTTIQSLNKNPQIQTSRKDALKELVPQVSVPQTTNPVIQSVAQSVDIKQKSSLFVLIIVIVGTILVLIGAFLFY